MRFDNLILADFNLFSMFMWGHWHPAALLAPILVAVTLTQVFLFTQSYPITVFIWMATTGAAILIGYAGERLMIIIWCFVYSHPGTKFWLALGTGVLLPLFNGTGCYLAANIHSTGDVCRRITCGLLGAFHLFGWHAGYIVGPCMLIIAAILPSVAADYVMHKGSTLTGAISAYGASKKKTAELALIFIP
jgi:hypothetical protein